MAEKLKKNKTYNVSLSANWLSRITDITTKKRNYGPTIRNEHKKCV